MGLLDLFSQNPESVTNITSSFSKVIPILIVVFILIGVLYWIRSLQKGKHTEIRIYRRP